MSTRALWWATIGVFAVALLVLAPSTGDIGLTWDEPSYRYSQEISQHWWGELAAVRSVADLERVLSSESLLYYWPYGRFGINFHPPLAGQLNLLTYRLFGGFLKDIPARRAASVIEFAATVALLFGFVARRSGAKAGLAAAGSLLLMPRLFGDAHIAGTDTPGLLLWALTAVAFWKGIHEENARGMRVAVGILLGLAFVEKMGAVMVLLPILLWLAPRILRARSRADWIDGCLTLTAMLLPLALAFREIRRLAAEFLRLQIAAGYRPDQVSPANTNLFIDRPVAELSAWILAIPLVVWVIRRLAARIRRSSPIWGVERPALETLCSIAAFAPVVGVLGNPAWWRETLPRLAHYYAISSQRRGVLPDIQILYFGQTYEYSLPWENAWVLIGITVPVGILIAAVVGVVVQLTRIARDRLPLYFLLHLAILPALRMLETPAHDGVRLFLPTFFFIAAFAGWGIDAAGSVLARVMGARGSKSDDSSHPRRRLIAWAIVASAALVPAAVQLVRIHPFELSYYNELIGGPAGAWKRGFELSYWYDAYNGPTLDEINRRVPDGSAIDTLNDMTKPPTFSCLQDLGALKGTLTIGTPDPNAFPYVWILTQDSKASALTRLLFAMTPFLEIRPAQLDGSRVVTVLDPATVARGWALQLLCDVGPADLPPPRPEPPSAPEWITRFAPPLARFWGDGVTKAKPLRVNPSIFEWASRDPETLRAAARTLADRPFDPPAPGSPAERLLAILTHSGRWKSFADVLLRARPSALVEAIEILIARGDAVRTVLTRYPYTDPASIGGPLDSR
ncbi:MAG: glycosyltransferase family 39 protein [Isosphaeraceae bacterium]|nr:glycosyltransferase family 39 protein [Isosphaeraceae bacterium]